LVLRPKFVQSIIHRATDKIFLSDLRRIAEKLAYFDRSDDEIRNFIEKTIKKYNEQYDSSHPISAEIEV